MAWYKCVCARVRMRVNEVHFACFMITSHIAPELALGSLIISRQNSQTIIMCTADMLDHLAHTLGVGGRQNRTHCLRDRLSTCVAACLLAI